MRVDLAYPPKILWPNGPEGNRFAKSKARKAAKNEAFWCTKEQPSEVMAMPVIPVRLTVHPKPKGPLPDRDNCIAAAKSLLDGIALGLGVNDRDFAEPTVTFAPERTSRFVIEVGLASEPEM